MRKIIIGVIIIIVAVGGYIFIKDRQIKKELSTVEQSQEVKENTEKNNRETASNITLNKTNGTWSVFQAGEYTIDPASLKFTFTGYKPGGEHTGTFNSIKSEIGLDKDGVPVSANMVIDIASVKTDSEAVDKHLQTADFFDAVNNPNITVDIKSIEIEGESSAKALTDITMKGVTKTISMPVTFVKVTNGTKFMIDTRVNIADFGIAYGPVLNEVRINTEGVVSKK
jgi:polyisoprenoid-binding protein YceI